MQSCSPHTFLQHWKAKQTNNEKNLTKNKVHGELLKTNWNINTLGKRVWGRVNSVTLGMRTRKKMKSLAFKDLESYTEEQIPSWVGICFLDLSKIDQPSEERARKHEGWTVSAECGLFELFLRMTGWIFTKWTRGGKKFQAGVMVHEKAWVRGKSYVQGEFCVILYTKLEAKQYLTD